MLLRRLAAVTFHDLRGTVVTRLGIADATPHEITALTVTRYMP